MIKTLATVNNNIQGFMGGLGLPNWGGLQIGYGGFLIMFKVEPDSLFN